MAKNASEPLEISQDVGAEDVPDPGAQGNAFAGNRANADNEMHHALRGAIMNGDTGGNSSIANAGMRLAAKFGSAATKSDKAAEKNRAAYMQVMMQQMLADLDQQIADMTDQINMLQNALNDRNSALWMGENEDVLSSEEQATLAIILDYNDINAEEYFAMSEQDRRSIAQDVLVSIEERRYEFIDKRRGLAALQDEGLDTEVFIEPLPVDNNRFLDVQYEAAAMRIEENQGIEFDRHNITYENMDLLQDTIRRMEIENYEQSINVEESIDQESNLMVRATMPLQIG